MRFRSLVGRRAASLAPFAARMPSAPTSARSPSRWHRLATTRCGRARFVGLEDERVRAIIGAVEHCTRPTSSPPCPQPASRRGSPPAQRGAARHADDGTDQHRPPRRGLEVYAECRCALEDGLGSSPSAALEAAQRTPSAVTSALRSLVTMTPVTASAVMPRQRRAERRHRHPPSRYHPRNSLQRTRPSLDAATCSRRCVTTRMACPGSSSSPDGPGQRPPSPCSTHARSHPPPGRQLYVNLRGFDAPAPPTAPLDTLRDMLEGLDSHRGAFPSHGRPLGPAAQHPRRASGPRPCRQRPRLPAGRTPAPGRGASLEIITSRAAMPGLAAFHQTLVRVEPFDDDEMVEFFGQRRGSSRYSRDRDAIIRLGRRVRWVAAGARDRRGTRDREPRASPWSCSSGNSPRSRRR